MSDPIRDIADRLARVERELHALATAPRANRTSVQGGYTRWLVEGPATTAPSIQIGADSERDDLFMAVNDINGHLAFAVGTLGGNTYVRVVNDDGTRDVIGISNGKVIGPLIPCTWQQDGFHTIDTNGRPLVSGGTYEPVWRSYLPVTSGGVLQALDVNPGGATSIAVRMTAHDIGSVVAPQVVFEQTGITTQTTIENSWAIPNTILSPAASPIGRLVELVIEVRISAGAGSAWSTPRFPAVNWVT